MSNIIEIKGLYKSFGDVCAVSDLSFSVEAGELFAFLGVNGAGKSTTINILCGMLRKDGGTLSVCGHDLDTEERLIKREIGVVFQSSHLDRALSVRENLESRAALYGIAGEAFEARLSALASLLDFERLLRRAVGKLSGGERRRIDIARALLHRPRLLILDEPTTGLDPQTRKLLWNVIDSLRKNEGLTVLLTTHYMEEAAEADRVLIIDGGREVASGTPHALKTAYSNDYITLYGAKEDAVRALGLPYEQVVGGYRIAVESTKRATELIIANPALFSDYEIVKGKMDDVFLAVTGKALSGGEEG